VQPHAPCFSAALALCLLARLQQANLRHRSRIVAAEQVAV
jgi:hypothetical protein